MRHLVSGPRTSGRPYFNIDMILINGRNRIQAGIGRKYINAQICCRCVRTTGLCHRNHNYTSRTLDVHMFCWKSTETQCVGDNSRYCITFHITLGILLCSERIIVTFDNKHLGSNRNLGTTRNILQIVVLNAKMAKLAWHPLMALKVTVCYMCNKLKCACAKH